MLSLRMGIWKDSKEKSKSSGTFTVLGKKFVIYVDTNNNKNSANSPDFWVTIKEYHDRSND